MVGDIQCIIEYERHRLIDEELREQALKLQKVEEETAHLFEANAECGFGGEY